MARISLRHGLKVDVWPGGVSVDPIDGDFAGYQCWGRQRDFQDADRGDIGGCCSEDRVDSVDLTQLSNHERLNIMGGSLTDEQCVRMGFDEGPGQFPVLEEEADGDFYAISREEAIEAKAKLGEIRTFSIENLVRIGYRSPDLGRSRPDAAGCVCCGGE